MYFTDRIYNKSKIENPLILKLISSPFFQRLKYIDQAGYCPGYFKNYHHTRYEHSLGVYLLLKKFKAPFKEQIAGLIHDISHSAFSHCIDYTLPQGSQKTHSHQDNIHKSYLAKTNIPKILTGYKINLDYILNDKNFPLKEKALPALCADRIDYSLRTALIAKEISPSQKDYILKNLIIINNNWVFKNHKSAFFYAALFKTLNDNWYSGIKSALMFLTTGNYLKHSLSKSYITKNDLYTTDKKVINKINKNLPKDKTLKDLWDKMNNKIKAINNPKNYHHIVHCKSRVINPLFLDKNKKVKNLSQSSPSWKKILKTDKIPKTYYIFFETN